MIVRPTNTIASPASTPPGRRRHSHPKKILKTLSLRLRLLIPFAAILLYAPFPSGAEGVQERDDLNKATFEKRIPIKDKLQTIIKLRKTAERGRYQFTFITSVHAIRHQEPVLEDVRATTSSTLILGLATVVGDPQSGMDVIDKLEEGSDPKIVILASVRDTRANRDASWNADGNKFDEK